MMRCLYNRFRFPAVPVTKVRQTLLRCVDRRKNTSERREKEVQVSLDLPNAACVLLLVRYDWTRSGRRNLVVRNVVWNPVMRVNVPHASVHALGLALIVTSAISEPARVIAVKSALILRRQATAPLAISAIRSAAVLAIIAVVIRIIVTITVSVLIDAIAVLVPIPIAVSIPIAILIAMVLIITIVGGDDHDRGGGHRRPDLVWPDHHGPEGRPQLLGEHLERFGSAEFVPKPAN